MCVAATGEYLHCRCDDGGLDDAPAERGRHRCAGPARGTDSDAGGVDVGVRVVPAARFPMIDHCRHVARSLSSAAAASGTPKFVEIQRVTASSMTKDEKSR